MTVALRIAGRRRRAALPTIEAYCGQASDNPQYQIELGKCLFEMAALGDDPRPCHGRALAILQALAGRGKLTADQMVWIPNLEKALAALPK